MEGGASAASSLNADRLLFTIRLLENVPRLDSIPAMSGVRRNALVQSCMKLLWTMESSLSLLT